MREAAIDPFERVAERRDHLGNVRRDVHVPLARHELCVFRRARPGPMNPAESTVIPGATLRKQAAAYGLRHTLPRQMKRTERSGERPTPDGGHSPAARDAGER